MLLETKQVNQMPVTPNSLADRFQQEDYPVYKDFISYYVSGVVGIRRFERNKCHAKYSSYVTISDEAFAVLTLENNWDRWSSMAKSKAWRDSDVATKWTTTKDRRKHAAGTGDQNKTPTLSANDGVPQARRYRGWSAQGIARYNQLFNEIKVERTKQSFLEFEEYLIEEFQEEAERDGQQGNKRQKVDNEKPLPVAQHELWNEEERQGSQRKIDDIDLPAGLEGLVGQREDI